ncbi:MAG TPA: hypothetical protein VF721_07405 [Pyrinomonadaceae bacterium]
MPADDFTSCKTKDDSNYDYFACQFFESLTRYQTTDPNGYWFGRLISFSFALNNLGGDNFTEDNFREDLENADIIIHSYELEEVSYQPVTNSTAVAVTGKVVLDMTKNESRSTDSYDFSFQISPGWLASSVTLS